MGLRHCELVANQVSQNSSLVKLSGEKGSRKPFKKGAATTGVTDLGGAQHSQHQKLRGPLLHPKSTWLPQFQDDILPETSRIRGKSRSLLEDFSVLWSENPYRQESSQPKRDKQVAQRQRQRQDPVKAGRKRENWSFQPLPGICPPAILTNPYSEW